MWNMTGFQNSSGYSTSAHRQETWLLCKSESSSQQQSTDKTNWSWTTLRTACWKRLLLPANELNAIFPKHVIGQKTGKVLQQNHLQQHEHTGCSCSRAAVNAPFYPSTVRLRTAGCREADIDVNATVTHDQVNIQTCSSSSCAEPTGL